MSIWDIGSLLKQEDGDVVRLIVEMLSIFGERE